MSMNSVHGHRWDHISSELYFGVVGVCVVVIFKIYYRFFCFQGPCDAKSFSMFRRIGMNLCKKPSAEINVRKYVVL
jgi:hypothetical protein